MKPETVARVQKASTKIFQIGFNRCGTTALHDFFWRNGLKSIHWDNGNLARKMEFNHTCGLPLLKGYESYQFYSDMEFAPRLYAHIKHFKRLDQQYPHSKFVLNIRDRNKWILSRLRHSTYCESFMRDFKLSIPQVVQLWEKQWAEHIEDVLTYFRHRTNLLVFDIERDSGASLTSFLSEFDLDVIYWKEQR